MADRSAHLFSAVANWWLATAEEYWYGPSLITPFRPVRCKSAVSARGVLKRLAASFENLFQLIKSVGGEKRRAGEKIVAHRCQINFVGGEKRPEHVITNA